jgi:hypothetical protein
MCSSRAPLDAPKSRPDVFDMRATHIPLCARHEYWNAYPSTYGRDGDVKIRVDNPLCDFLMKIKGALRHDEIFGAALRERCALPFYTVHFDIPFLPY